MRWPIFDSCGSRDFWLGLSGPLCIFTFSLDSRTGSSSYCHGESHF